MFDAALEVPLERAAQEIGMNKEWLRNVIALESSWRWNAYNPVSGAVGLIQFIPRTLKDLGLLSPSLAMEIPATGAVSEATKQKVREEFLAKYPNAVAQLAGPVVRYMRIWRPFPTEQSAYLAVFYPKFRYSSPDTPFPDSVRKANPGIDTVGDYVTAVKKKSNSETWWRRVLRYLRLQRAPD